MHGWSMRASSSTSLYSESMLLAPSPCIIFTATSRPCHSVLSKRELG
jgi:hypothetical protein